VEREIRAVNGTMTASHVRSMDQMVADSLSRQNFNALLLTVFAAIALLLAAIGIYGLMSYSVEQRMQEIGIRVALGASRGDVLRLMVLQGMKLAGIGVVVGLAAAWWAWPPLMGQHACWRRCYSASRRTTRIPSPPSRRWCRLWPWRLRWFRRAAPRAYRRQSRCGISR
jgi:hypothetical protein